MPDEQDIYKRLNKYQDAQLAAFEAHLRQIIERAQDATTAYVVRNMQIDDGVLTSAARNTQIARRLDDIFMAEMEKAGYRHLVSAFVGSFHEQLPTIQELLELLADQAKTTLPKLAFTNADLNLFTQTATAANSSVRDEIAMEAKRAFNKVMFSVGGLPFKDMVGMIRDGMGQTLSRATSLANTAQSGFYRVALERQYNKIEADTGQELRYRYSGPRDFRNRPFCAMMLAKSAAGETWTKAEFNALNNHSIRPVFIFCGGINCRHQPIISFAAMFAEKRAA